MLKKLLRACLWYALLGVVLHLFGQALPRRRLHPARAPWRPAAFEKEGRIYERLGVKRWKDKVPDMSRILPDMVKKRLPPGTGAEGSLRLAQETCAAELTHWVGAVVSVGVPVCLGGVGMWLFWGIYVLLGHLPFLIIQRYNRPRLLRVAARMNQRKEGVRV